MDLLDVLNQPNDLSGDSRPIYEQERPRRWADVLGQDKALQALAELAPRWTGKAYWFSGKSGTGKTTIANILAGQVADAVEIIEYDGQSFSVADLEWVLGYFATYAMGKRGGKVVIVNESHGLSKTIVRRLLVALESIPQHCMWIFTTTVEGQKDLLDCQIDAHPLLSRCKEITLETRGLNPLFAAKAKEIAERRGLDGRPIEQYMKQIEAYRGNMRRLLEHVELGRMKS